MTHEVILRRARREDVAAIIGLFGDDELSTSGDAAPAGPPSACYLDAFEEIAASPTAELWVAR